MSDAFLSYVFGAEVGHQPDDVARHIGDDGAGLLQALSLMGPCLSLPADSIVAELIIGGVVKLGGGLDCNAWGR